MIPALLLRASARHFARHPWLLVLALLGLVLGVAVVVGVEVTNDSARHNFQLANERLLGRATHRIEAEGRIPETLLTRLRTELGVTAGPLISTYLRLGNDEGPVLQLLAVDVFQVNRFRPQATAAAGDDVDLQDLMLTDRGALIGASTRQRLGLESDDSLTVVSAAGRHQLSLLGTLGEPGDARFDRLLLMDIGQAQRMLGLAGQLDAIELSLTDTDAQQVGRWLPPGYRLDSAAAQRTATQGLGEALHLNLSALSLLAMVVGLFLAYNCLSFSLLQRQQLFAQLRTLGLTRRELGGYLALELAVLGLLGTLLGGLLGLALADKLLWLVTRTLNDLYGVSPIQLLRLSPGALAKSLGVALGALVLAGWGPLRWVLSRPIREAGSQIVLEAQAARLGPLQVLLGLGLIVAALGLGSWTATGLAGGYLAVAGLLLGTAALVPATVVCGCRGLEAVLGLIGRPRLILQMALRDARRGMSRSGVALMALTLAIAATVGMGTMIGSFRSTLETWLQQRLNADIYLAPLTQVPGDPRTLDPALWSWLGTHPQVRAVASSLRVETRVGGQRLELFATRLPPPARDGYRFVGGDEADAWAGFDQTDQILISEPLANRQGVAPGATLTLVTPRGPQPFRVAGVYYDYGHDRGRILISRDNFARYWQPRPGRVAGLYLEPGVDAATVADTLERRFEGVRVTRTQGVLERSLAIFERTFLVTEVLRLLAVAVAFAGMLAAVLALQLERQPELRLYHALGFSPAERLRLLLYQALLIGLLAGGLAIPTGLALAWGLIHWIQLRAFGWSLVWELQPTLLLQAPLLAVAASLLAFAYPAWRLVRGGYSRAALTRAEA